MLIDDVTLMIKSKTAKLIYDYTRRDAGSAARSPILSTASHDRCQREIHR